MRIQVLSHHTKMRQTQHTPNGQTERQCDCRSPHPAVVSSCPQMLKQVANHPVRMRQHRPDQNDPLSVVMRAPVLSFHRCNVWRKRDAEVILKPLGENVTQATPPEWPSSVAIGVPVLPSHSRT